jgi:hypothetical protein
MTEILIEGVDVDLAEDNRTVIAWGYGSGDTLFMQSITMPMAIDPDAFLGDDWLLAFSRDGWRQVA